MPPEMIRPFIESFSTIGLGTEIIYSFVIIICSLMVYFGTRELYELSSYKGLKYFRQAFLFFAIAYFFRSFIRAVLFLFNSKEILDISPRMFGGITMFVFMYFSAMAMFYLVYSIMWKRWSNNPKLIYLFHLFAFIIAIFSTITRDPIVRSIITILILIAVLILVYKAHKYSKKNDSMYLIYVLLFIFVILNILDILVPPFLELFKLVIYLASTGIFLAVLYKVLRRTGK